MPRGTYERTSEIRDKQSKTMKVVTLTLDHEEITRKTKETLTKKGIKSGRKPGDAPARKYVTWCKICGIFTENTVYCSRRCQYIDPDYKQKLVKDNSKACAAAAIVNSQKMSPAWRKYRNRVCRLTEKIYVIHYDSINPNHYPRTLAGVEGGWQLDHIISIREGFDNGMPEELLSCASNLRMLPWRLNLARNKK